MAARIGIITQKGLAANIMEQIQSPSVRKAVILLILAAIVIGNAAYEAGNISGASLGMQSLVGIDSFNYYPVIIGIVAFTLLYIGSYKILERSLIALVLLMSCSFLITAMITKPDITLLFKEC